jgi:ATP-dependent helicase Lhr and Lhr-like helicase
MPLAAFHPTLATWFRERLGEPTPPQVKAWPAIRRGDNVLVAAPTGSGKTLAAFLSALDELLTQAELADECRVLYVSPLKALGNDVQKNLLAPLEELRARDADLPEVRVLVRSGDTPQRERAKMIRRPPHVLVTTPESLYILLTSEGGRGILRTVRCVIVDEIHALCRDKRGSHLALSLERLEDLTEGPLQRIGLSATQRPIERVAKFLVGPGRECTLVDEGHRRQLELSVRIPPSPLEPVCSHETWSEIYQQIAALVTSHRTTLIFVGTRKLAERISAQLAELCGADRVRCHHSSLAKERRLEAEHKLKDGQLAALVATASLELGIDVGEVDLAIQIGSARTIAGFLQRIGRAGHGVGRIPKGVLFPLSPDELVEHGALLLATRRGELDRLREAPAARDVLVQQVIAECVAGPRGLDELLELARRTWTYRDLTREQLDAVVDLHTQGRGALLHRDGVGDRLLATRRARLVAITSGGAIPDNANYKVVLEPGGTVVGSVDEDFAIESSGGDVFQLGNASWRVLKAEPGILRVADAEGAPPSLPFWFGEAPARSPELCELICEVREAGRDPAWLMSEVGLSEPVAGELARYLEEGARALGAVPTNKRLIIERFFDESGGMQLVLHSPRGGRINRALGLALRKRFCRGFGFELQAAANEQSIVISLGPQHSFPLEDVFDFVAPEEAEHVLIQALLPTPMFTTRWRWNVSRALLLERRRGGKRVPSPLLRMRADDLLVQAFPAVVACPENLPSGDLEVPRDHPMVAETLEDCLHEAMDLRGLIAVLEGLRDGSIERVTIDTPEPSAYARGALAIGPYGFLDDAPLEERRTQAVLNRRALSPRDAQVIGALDPDAVARVSEEAWPDPRNPEEVHEALLWMGYVTTEEAAPWSQWLDQLAQAGRVTLEHDRWFATEATRDDKAVLRGRMEALGPVFSDDPLMLSLEADGVVLRTQLDGRQAWCDRRLLARIQRYTLETLRRQIRPVPAATFLRFLAVWQHLAPGARLEGPQGVLEVVRQLAGFEAPVGVWEKELIAPRVQGYRPSWLDELGLAGRIAWGRLWGASKVALRAAPVALVPRDELNLWRGLSPAPAELELSWPARALREALSEKGALFQSDLEAIGGLLPSDVERGLEELVAAGLVTSDSFASLRQHLIPASRRKAPLYSAGRWSLLSRGQAPCPEVEEVALLLLRRYGVLFRALLERERLPIPWREFLRALRRLELRGQVRGGRFVARFAGEQFALPEAVKTLRRVAAAGEGQPETPLEVSTSDCLNLHGVLTPAPKVSAGTRGRVPLC